MRLYLKIIKQIKNRDIMMTIIIIIAAEKRERVTGYSKSTVKRI